MLRAPDSSSRALVEACLERATDPAGEGGRAFLKLWPEAARAAAEACDRGRSVAAPLAGIPVSIKDLFDVAGETTLAGSRVRIGAAPAARDATVVRRLREAGAILIGRTNMSEFAFSPVGLNPHYGTPGNPWDRARVPGGSSSGAAVSVADGMAACAVGSDTGGSIRVPAALCGLVGFKPTQARVPLEGAYPLSATLDSVGAIARSVEDCAILDAVLAGESFRLESVDLGKLRFCVPRSVVLDGLDKQVGEAFSRALSTLSKAGATLVESDMPLFAEIVQANAKGGFSPAEGLALHEESLASRGGEYDPRARARFEQGRAQSAADYVRLCWRRAQLMEAGRSVMAAYDALLMPTCPAIAPRIDEVEGDDAAFWKYNNLLSRNTALINFLGGCALSLPVQMAGEAPVGLMVTGAAFADPRVLAIGASIERAFRRELAA